MNRTARDRVTGFLLKYATAIIFIVVFVYFGVSASNFFSTENTLNIVKQASFVGVIAVGMTFVLLTGGIDLSVGSNMYVSAMTVGYLLQLPAFQGGFGVFAGIVVGLATGAAFGAINAFCVVFLRITPFLVTLATMVAGHGLVTAITESYGIDYPPAFTAFGACFGPRRADPDRRFRDRGRRLAHVVLTRTQFGRQLYAVGNDAEAARKAGIDTDRIVFCGLRHLRSVRGARRRHADRARRSAQPDFRRRQGVRRDHRRRARRHEPLRRRWRRLRRRCRLGAGADGAGRHGVREGQSLPAADGARGHHLHRRLLRQPARGAADQAEAAVHPHGHIQPARRRAARRPEVGRALSRALG